MTVVPALVSMDSSSYFLSSQGTFDPSEGDKLRMQVFPRDEHANAITDLDDVKAVVWGEFEEGSATREYVL